MSTFAGNVSSPNSAVNHALASLDIQSNQDIRNRKRVASKSEMLVDGGANTFADDRVGPNGKDVGHTFRGEFDQRDDIAAVATQRKKSVHKPVTPKWQTILNVLMKISLLIMALLWIGQFIVRRVNGPSSLTYSDIENRLNEVEGLKKTARMLHTWLDSFDKKLGSEIGKAKAELIRQVEHHGSNLESKMKELEGRTNKLDNAVAELREGFVSKKDFDQFLDEMRKHTGDSPVDLDDIRNFAKQLVEAEIEKHAADGLGMVDFALSSAGAKVVKHSEPVVLEKGLNWFSSRGRSGVHQDSRKMLEPSFGEPGQCFALVGSAGFVEIKLRTEIIPEAVTLEHVHPSVAFDLSSAPKDCKVTAWSTGPDNGTIELPTFELVAFSFDLTKGNVQTFKVESTFTHPINIARLEFSSNHGNPHHTCIYRFRVHGVEHTSPVAMGQAEKQVEALS